MDPANQVVEARHAPGGVGGSIRVPASKSLTQRALVAAALAGRGSAVRHPLDAEDPRLLFEALQAAGFRLVWEADAITAQGRDPVEGATLHLGNNGTGVRFLLAQLAAVPGSWVVNGSERLRQRPIAPLVGALRHLGARIQPVEGLHDALPLRVHGQPLRGGRVELDASASSQFVSALLLLGATLPEGLSVRLAAPPPSRPYLDLTAEVLEAFGAPLIVADNGTSWSVRGGVLTPAQFSVEGDWSAAAFPMAAAAVAGGEVEVVGVRRESRQGDAAVLGMLAGAGCRIHESSHGVVVGGPATGPLDADLRDTPDLFPALAVLVASVGGKLTGLAGLATKESDRLSVMTVHLTTLGFAVEAGAAWFAGGGRTRRRWPGDHVLDPAGDHRVAMALAVAGCAVPGVRITDPGCVAKSWPGFWAAWQGIGRAGS
ncbi:MAG: 3-phosphoshikimate 1-carboxyvinyltransferase [Acidobacteria bacterium RBG_13_68_16]|nr:MAG: 3-phosphoshikimate 1-carboxyvinyltransferase [Acidobacteria bacterium RBG_13_68_16]